MNTRYERLLFLLLFVVHRVSFLHILLLHTNMGMTFIGGLKDNHHHLSYDHCFKIFISFNH